MFGIVLLESVPGCFLGISALAISIFGSSGGSAKRIDTGRVGLLEFRTLSGAMLS